MANGSGCVELLPLCTIPKMATREGMTGATAYMNVVGVGIWFASGQQLTFPSSKQVQDKSRVYQGTVKPDTFNKGFAGISNAACPA